jgi:hypothetical protein
MRYKRWCCSSNVDETNWISDQFCFNNLFLIFCVLVVVELWVRVRELFNLFLVVLGTLNKQARLFRVALCANLTECFHSWLHQQYGSSERLLT